MLTPTLPQTEHLRQLCRSRGEVFTARLVVADQLRAVLGRYWPGAAAVFDRVDSLIALAFLNRYPTPRSAARLTTASMATFLRRHAYSGKKDPAELVAQLRRAPRSASTLPDEVLCGLIAASVMQLQTALSVLKDLERLIDEQLDVHPYAALFAAMPRIGTLNLAQIVGEVGPILERAESAEHLAAEAGVFPVTYESGKKRSVSFRAAANRRARQALTVFADNSRHADPWAAALYAAARARGHQHPHAIRILARAWVRILWQELGRAFQSLLGALTPPGLMPNDDTLLGYVSASRLVRLMGRSSVVTVEAPSGTLTEEDLRTVLYGVHRFVPSTSGGQLVGIIDRDAVALAAARAAITVSGQRPAEKVVASGRAGGAP